MANVFDEHGKIIGAGGGQAGDVNLAPVLVHGEPRPVDAPGPIQDAVAVRGFATG